MSILVTSVRKSILSDHLSTETPEAVHKAAAYTSFVRPQLEYASTFWCPHAANNINRLESVQRCARSVMNT